MKDLLEMEAEGYRLGNNPIDGTFLRKFAFAPVPYGSKNSEQFVLKVRKALADIKYVFFGEVKIVITLYLDEQKRLETPELADLDNYAKLLCDSLKGPEGLLIDDAQIQSLSISWIDTPNPSCFELEIRGMSDEFIMKPLALFEMPNGLFYPVPSRRRIGNIIKNTPRKRTVLLLAALNLMTSEEKDLRRKLRRNGSGPLEAFWTSRYISPMLAGFHKSRIVDSGFPLRHVKEWKRRIQLDKALKAIKTTRARKHTRH